MKLQYCLVLAVLLGYCSGFIVPQSDGSLTVVSPNEKFTTDHMTLNGNNLYTELTSASSYSSFVRPLYISNIDSLIYQYIPAYSPQDSLVVTVNGTTFLFIAMASSSQQQPIYKWNPNNEKFEFFQFVGVSMNNYQDYEYFQYNGNHYLVLSCRDASTNILRYNASTWVSVQSIATAYDAEFFTIGTTNWICFASSAGFNFRIFNSSALVESTGPSFSGTGKDVEAFTIGTTTYVAGASAGSSVEIFYWTGSTFASFQSIPATMPNSVKFFTASGENFLAIAEKPNLGDVNSEIYKWNGTAFALFQSIPDQGAFDMDTFTMGGEIYLVVSCYSSTSDGLFAPSAIYKYNGYLFTKVTSMTTRGATGARQFTIGTNDYLFITNLGSETNYSYLYKLTF